MCMRKGLRGAGAVLLRLQVHFLGSACFRVDPEIGLGVLSSTASALRTRNEDTLEMLSDQV